MGYMEGWEDQNFEHCFFLEGYEPGGWFRDAKGAVKLGDVEPVVLSEVLSDMTAIAAKGK